MEEVTGWRSIFTTSEKTCRAGFALSGDLMNLSTSLLIFSVIYKEESKPARWLVLIGISQATCARNVNIPYIFPDIREYRGEQSHQAIVNQSLSLSAIQFCVP